METTLAALDDDRRTPIKKAAVFHMDVSVGLIGVRSEEHNPAFEARVIASMLRHADLNHATDCVAVIVRILSASVATYIACVGLFHVNLRWFNVICTVVVFAAACLLTHVLSRRCWHVTRLRLLPYPIGFVLSFSIYFDGRDPIAAHANLNARHPVVTPLLSPQGGSRPSTPLANVR